MTHHTYSIRFGLVVAAALGTALAVGACTMLPPSLAKPKAAAGDAVSVALHTKVQTIVVIYTEGRSFDALFGSFPGARALSDVVDAGGRPLAAYVPQLDRDGSLLSKLPPSWGGVTAPGYKPVVTQAQSAGLPNAPFSIEHGFNAQSNVTLSTAAATRDLVQRFFEQQMQIDGGRNDGYAAWSDGGGLALGHYDYSHTGLYALARQYVLADHFFQGAFGGGFLNHQYLICACAPEYPGAAAKPLLAVLDPPADGKLAPRLKLAKGSPTSALEGPPKFVNSGIIAPANYFGDGKSYAVNTLQPPYQPSGNAPARSDGAGDYADPANATTLPPQSAATIGDRLSARNVDWAWYAGSWNAAVADGRQPAPKKRKIIIGSAAAASPNFKPEHQPFNFYARFDPKLHAEDRAQHLKDYEQFLVDIGGGQLPPVVFYQPQGNILPHAGAAAVADGDAHIAEVVAKLQAGPQWNNMVIVIAADDSGGSWDHLAPPKGDLLGPGARVAAIVVSPFAKMGTVDHTPYDTASILRFITRRFDLEVLPGVAARDKGLAGHSEYPMGDLTNALNLQGVTPKK